MSWFRKINRNEFIAPLFYGMLAVTGLYLLIYDVLAAFVMTYSSFQRYFNFGFLIIFLIFFIFSYVYTKELKIKNSEIFRKSFLIFGIFELLTHLSYWLVFNNYLPSS